MEGHEMIALYEHVAILSGHMLDAARRSDWDRLTELESLCARQVAALRGSDPPGRLDDEERGRKIELINRILANDREIRALTEPWMAHLAMLINSAGAQRKLAKAYGGTQYF